MCTRKQLWLQECGDGLWQEKFEGLGRAFTEISRKDIDELNEANNNLFSIKQRTVIENQGLKRQLETAKREITTYRSFAEEQIRDLTRELATIKQECADVMDRHEQQLAQELAQAMARFREWKVDPNFTWTIIDSAGNYVGQVKDPVDRSNIINAHNAAAPPENRMPNPVDQPNEGEPPVTAHDSEPSPP
jgi:hypothetical protein